MKIYTYQMILAATLLASPAPSFAQDGHDHDKPAAKPQAASGDDHEGHDHGKPATPAKPAANEGHGHGADEHGGEHSDEVKLTEAAIQLNGITVSPATKRSLTASFMAPGRVAFNAEAMAHVGSVVSGRVTEIKVRQGDAVKKGDVLLTVESPELGRSQSDFLQKQTQAAVAAAAVTPSKDAYDRAKTLFDESQGIALSEVQKREVEYRAAVGMQATTQASVDAAENELHLYGFTQEEVEKLSQSKEIKPQFVIRAPIDGHVIEREVTLGELVAPDKERLLVLADTSHLWVLADVAEARLGQVGAGSSAEIQLSSAQQSRIIGEVSLVSAEVDPTTRAARVRIVVENKGNLLKPGMFARVVLAAATATDAVLAIPEGAVQTVEGKPSVFVPVEGEPNTFARREVIVGKSINGYAPVISGLNEGEPLVISGTFIMKAELGKGSAEHVH